MKMTALTRKFQLQKEFIILLSISFFSNHDCSSGSKPVLRPLQTAIFQNSQDFIYGDENPQVLSR